MADPVDRFTAADFDPPEPPPDPTVFRAPQFERGRRYMLGVDFLPILAGRMEPPNFKPIPHWDALRLSISLYGHTVERYQEPFEQFDRRVKAKIGGKLGDAIYYLNVGQGGGFTGEGVVVLHWGYQYDEEHVVTGRFALCEHKKVEGPGANHQRGWHPGWCEKCGLDMSVDSGD